MWDEKPAPRGDTEPKRAERRGTFTTRLAALTGLIAISTATLSGATFGLVASVHAQQEQASRAQPVIVTPARTADVVDRIEALGTTKANESLQITATVTEKIVNIGFDDGQSVEAGDVLVELDRAEEEAELKKARAFLEDRRRALERTRQLERKSITSTEDLELRQTELVQAEAEIEALQARIADRIIRAPFNGVVGMRDISVGALVAPGDLITTLDDLHVVKLDFTVPTTYLTALERGLPITARADALGNQAFDGTIQSIGSRADPATRAIAARAVLPNPDGLLKPGLLMRVELRTNPRQAVVIPEAALVPMGQRQYVMVVDEAAENRVERREVRIGTRRPGDVEVVSGLAPGEKVITHGTTTVRPGDTVVIRAVDDGSRRLHEMLQPDAPRTETRQ